MTNATVVTPVDPDLDNEAVRVVGNMPKWTPGTLNGAPVRVKYSIPVRFSLPKSTTTPFVSERERLKKEWKAIDEKYDAKYQRYIASYRQKIISDSIKSLFLLIYQTYNKYLRLWEQRQKTSASTCQSTTSTESADLHARKK